MKLKNKLFLLYAVVLSIVSFAGAQTLQSIEIVHMEDKSEEVQYHFDGNIAHPFHRIVNNILVLDLPKATVSSSQKNKAVNDHIIHHIVNLQDATKLRSQIFLASPVDYSVVISDNRLLVNLAARNPFSVNTPASRGDVLLQAKNVDNHAADINRDVIEFSRNSKGSGVISIQLPSDQSSDQWRVQSLEMNQQLQVKIKGHVWGQGQEKRLEVSDFATLVKQVEVINHKGTALVNISTDADFEYSAYQTGSKYVIELKAKRSPSGKKTGAGKELKSFSGERLSLNFQDIDVRAVLQIIAEFTGLNIVVSDAVNSHVTLRLIDVPWDQALDVILKTKALGMRQQGQVIYIAPQAELKGMDDLEPLINEIIQINYAKAEDVAKVLSEGKSGTESMPSAGLSSRGKVSVDARTNHLIIQDTASQILMVKDLIKILDQPIRQVQIDAKVVVTSDDFARDLGVRWGLSGADSARRAYSKDENGNVVAQKGYRSGNFFNGDTKGNQSMINGDDPRLVNSIVNLAAASATSSLALSIVRSSIIVDLELSAMQTSGKGETLASPRVFTADRQKAYIKSGRQIPFNTVDEAGNTVVTFKDIVLSLDVTPQITPDNKVILDLQINKDDVAGSDVATAGFLKNEIKTQAIVANGETVVLGGVFTEITSENFSKVPFLADIPFLGKLFQKKGKSHQKAELIIFVTPHIVDPVVKK